MNIDFRADIYALGATLYHLVTGRVPFQAPTPAAVMHKHLKEPLVPPDHINTSLSSGLGEVVEVMMAKDRDRRYASTTDVLTDLEAIAAGEAPLQARKRFDADALTLDVLNAMAGRMPDYSDRATFERVLEEANIVARIEDVWPDVAKVLDGTWEMTPRGRSGLPQTSAR